MLVLIATNELQGVAPGDYAHTVEGELVTAIVTECDCPECGCDRGFPGLGSSRATTTAMVIERPGISEADLREAVGAWLERDGWVDLLAQAAEVDREEGREPEDPDAVIAEMIDEHVEVIAEICSHFPDGTVITRKGTRIWRRAWPRAA